MRLVPAKDKQYQASAVAYVLILNFSRTKKFRTKSAPVFVSRLILHNALAIATEYAQATAARWNSCTSIGFQIVKVAANTRGATIRENE